MALPALHILFDAARALAPGEPFWKLEPAFTRYVHSQSLRTLLAAKLRRLLTRPGDTLNLQPGLTWRVAGVPQATLFVRLMLPAEHDPENAPAHRLQAPADARPLRLRCYRAQGVRRPDVLEDGIVLQATGERTVEPGTVVRLEARYDVVVPLVDEVQIIWELCAAPAFGQRWIYDPETLRPAFAMTASRALTQLDYSLAVLRDIGDARACAVLEEHATGHPEHFIRYRACEAVCALAPERSEGLLRKLLDDPHPHLQAVARQALGQGEPE